MTTKSYTLSVKSGKSKDTKFLLSNNSKIGSTAACDVQIPEIEGEYAVFQIKDNGVSVKPLARTNKVSVNGKQLPFGLFHLLPLEVDVHLGPDVVVEVLPASPKGAKTSAKTSAHTSQEPIANKLTEPAPSSKAAPSSKGKEKPPRAKPPAPKAPKPAATPRKKKTEEEATVKKPRRSTRPRRRASSDIDENDDEDKEFIASSASNSADDLSLVDDNDDADKRLGAKYYSVCCIGAALAHLEPKIESLGCTLEYEHEFADVFVADKVRRTINFLCALNTGFPIVSPAWVDDSCRKREVQNPQDYILVDKDMEAKYNFTLQESIARARRKTLFKGMKFLLADGIVPTAEEMKRLIRSGGGDVTDKAADNVYVIGHKNMDKNLYAPDIVKKEAEFVLVGILRQELDMENYGI